MNLTVICADRLSADISQPSWHVVASGVQLLAHLTLAERVKVSDNGSSSFSPQNSQLTQISGPGWISLTKVFYYSANYPLVNNMGM